MSQHNPMPPDAEGADKRIDSKSIFGSGKMVWIEHESTLYRLMITRQGKLILTK